MSCLYENECYNNGNNCSICEYGVNYKEEYKNKDYFKDTFKTVELTENYLDDGFGSICAKKSCECDFCTHCENYLDKCSECIRNITKAKSNFLELIKYD